MQYERKRLYFFSAKGHRCPDDYFWDRSPSWLLEPGLLLMLLSDASIAKSMTGLTHSFVQSQFAGEVWIACQLDADRLIRVGSTTVYKSPFF